MISNIHRYLIKMHVYNQEWLEKKRTDVGGNLHTF